MKNRLAVTLLALLAVAAVGWLDYSTTNQFRSVLFYVVPVVFTAWFANTLSTVFISLTCAVTFALAGSSGNLHGFTPVWSGASTFTLLLFVGLLILTLRRQGQESLRAAAHIRELLARETEAAHTDPLTELPNLREFRKRLEPEVARCRRQHQPLCLMYLDLDNFKLVNDFYGHAAGDEVLNEVASILRRHLRSGDVPARLGGDEFAALLWQVDELEARKIAGRVLAEVRVVGENYPGCSLSASAGIVWYDRPPEDPSEIVRRADTTMYTAKRTGKRRVVMVKPSQSAGELAPVRSARDS